MAAMGRAARGHLDSVLAEVAKSGASLRAIRELQRSRAERFDALMHPVTARDYGEAMTGEEFLAECKLRGIDPPDWCPR